VSGVPNTVSPKQEPQPATGRRAARRAATQAEILAAAWELVRAEGLAGLSMRDLGARVGMRAQSIYSYYSSKFAIYDAMFLEGYEAFEAWMAPVYPEPGPPLAPDEAVDLARHAVRRFFTFCTSDPARYQLLFQRTIPGFVPSEASYAVAQRVYAQMSEGLAALGITDPGGVDLWTAVTTGLTDQQISNDPGGDRWERLIDQAVDMLVAHLAPHLFAGATTQTRTSRTTRSGT
jgi:AcrR family transcriptional regulator